MIEIKQHDRKWRITIKEETFQFKNLEELKLELNKLLEMKDKFGDII